MRKSLTVFMIILSLMASGAHTQPLKIRTLPEIPLAKAASTVIWLDIHGVMVHLNSMNAAWACVKVRWTPRVFARFMINNIKGKLPPETAYKKALIQCGYNQNQQKMYLDRFCKMCNQQRLAKSFINSMRNLKKRGVTFYINSNIGEQTYQGLIKKYPEIASLVRPNQVITPTDRFPVKKPDTQAFARSIAQMQANNHLVNKTHIIFVDDKEKNIKSAQEFGKSEGLNIKGIHFKNSNQAIQQIYRTIANRH